MTQKRPAEQTAPEGEKRRAQDMRLVCAFCQDPVPRLVEDYKQGDVICYGCGYVFKGYRIIDMHSEWRTFSDDRGADPNRVGAAENEILFGQSSHVLETAIGTGGKDLQKAHIRMCSSATEGGKDASTSSSSNRSLLAGFKDIGMLGDRMGLSRAVQEAAKQYLKLAVEKELVRGKIEVVSAVCLLLGCRKNGQGHTLQEFADVVSTPRTEFGKVFVTINRGVAQLGAVNPEHISEKYCNALGLVANVRSVVSAICKNARNVPGMEARTPATIAGACIYVGAMLAGKSVGLGDVSNMCKVSDSTIRQAYRLMSNNLNILLEGDRLSEYSGDLKRTRSLLKMDQTV